MSNIIIRSGHSPRCKGAMGIVDEQLEMRKVLDELVKIVGKKAYCYVSTESERNKDLQLTVEMTKSKKATLSISIHANASNGKGKGTECWVYPNSNAKGVATSICKEISSLGFSNRGVKESYGLYELRKTPCSHIIIETFFVDNKEDVANYHKIGAKSIAKAIAKGLGLYDEENPLEANKGLYTVQVGAYSNRANAVTMQNLLRDKGIPSFITLK